VQASEASPYRSASANATHPTAEIRKAIEGARLQFVELVRRCVVAHPVGAIIGEIHDAAVPIEADRVADAPGNAPEVPAVWADADNRPLQTLGLANVTRRADRNVQPTVWPGLDVAQAVVDLVRQPDWQIGSVGQSAARLGRKSQDAVARCNVESVPQAGDAVGGDEPGRGPHGRPTCQRDAIDRVAFGADV
jgi:hypothetical protein